MCAKGLDAGECYIVGAEARSGEIVFTPERAIYLCWKPGDAVDVRARSMGVYTLPLGGRTYALGQDAVRVAQETGKEDELVSPFRRSLPRGEEERVIATILSAIIGVPDSPGETVAYTVHGNPVDGGADFAGAGRIWNALVASLGFSPMPFGRARAAILGANPERAQRGEPCPAVSLVFGETAVDVAVDCREGFLEFSLLRGTDWIDGSVARMKSIRTEEVGALRESRLNLEAVDRSDPLLATLEIYFEHQIHYTLQQIQAQIMKAGLSPMQPLDFIATGPGAACPGFAAKFEKDAKEGKIRYADLKSTLAERLAAYLAPFREKRRALAATPDEVWGHLHDGTEAARKIASATLKEAKEKMGFI